MNAYRNRFIITGYPRSMTAWWSNYCNVGRYTCTHERCLSNLKKGFNADVASVKPYNGDADSGWLLFPERIIEELSKGLRVLIIQRDREACLASVVRAAHNTQWNSQEFWKPILERMEESINMLQKKPGVKTIYFGGIYEQIIRGHQFLMPDQPVNEARTHNLKKLKITRNYGGILSCKFGDLQL